MAEDHNIILRNILANIQAGDSEAAPDSVSQLLAAAVAQIGNGAELTDLNAAAEHSMNEEETAVEPTLVEEPKRKPMCVKIPVELRKRIIAMRKEGKKYIEVAKELHVSVSGAQKIWERFLATGTVHDQRPSTYAGRPRKYSQSQVIINH